MAFMLQKLDTATIIVSTVYQFNILFKKLWPYIKTVFNFPAFNNYMIQFQLKLEIRNIWKKSKMLNNIYKQTEQHTKSRNIGFGDLIKHFLIKHLLVISLRKLWFQNHSLFRPFHAKLKLAQAITGRRTHVFPNLAIHSFYNKNLPDNYLPTHEIYFVLNTRSL